jgi:hypothetical protein
MSRPCTPQPRRAAAWSGRFAVVVAVLVALGAGPFRRGGPEPSPRTSAPTALSHAAR